MFHLASETMETDTPPEKKSSLLNAKGVGLIGLLIAAFNVVIVIINLVASSGYTPKSQFDVLKEQFRDYKESNALELSHIREGHTSELAKIANGITELNGKMIRNVEQDEILKDHETRIRTLQEGRKR